MAICTDNSTQCRQGLSAREEKTKYRKKKEAAVIVPSYSQLCCVSGDSGLRSHTFSLPSSPLRPVETNEAQCNRSQRHKMAAH